MSAESAQRLKAQAAESGLHQSDSGLASECNSGCFAIYVWCVYVGLQVCCHLAGVQQCSVCEVQGPNADLLVVVQHGSLWLRLFC